MRFHNKRSLRYLASVACLSILTACGTSTSGKVAVPDRGSDRNGSHRVLVASDLAALHQPVGPTPAQIKLWNDTVLWNNTVKWNTAAGVFFVGATSSFNGFVCGGVLPSCCTLEKESHGTPTAQNPSSSASGLWQFMHDTWGGYGGFMEAKYAPPGTQNERAAQVFAGGAGWGAWAGDGCYPGG